MPGPSIVEIKGFLQPFPYGREGEASMAARFAKEVDPSIEIKPNQPYGEIWLGSTHQNGPSEVLSGPDKGKKLRDLIATDPKFYLGEKLMGNGYMQELYKNDLPFLFKILSFDKALPLQAHPDPELGDRLRKWEFAQKGKNEDFVDSNGKPEVSVALSDFTAFVGFRPPSHIAAFLSEVPELAGLFSQAQIEAITRAVDNPDDSAGSKQALRSLFDTLIKLPGSNVQGVLPTVADKVGLSENKVRDFIATITSKIERHGASAAFGSSEDAEALARIWNKNLKVYGDSDVGLIVTSYLMNLLQLEPGQGCWILADDIHAYVEGDVIECMAASDNMTCHGLGPTEQGGIQTFVDMLTYRHLPGKDLLLEYEDGWSKGKHGKTRLYKVSMIDEFDIIKITLGGGGEETASKREVITLPGPHTFVVTQGTVRVTVHGETLTLGTGHVAFVRAGAEMEVELVEGTKGEIWGSFYQ